MVFRDFLGHYDGDAIGRRLGLDEVPSPEHGPPLNGLARGQFYLWQPMSRHPELHALMTRDGLQEVAKIVRDYHFDVTRGAELLPKVAGPAPLAHHGSAMKALTYSEPS